MIGRYIWAAVGVVALAYILMSFVHAYLPVLITISVLYVVYLIMFKRRL